MIAASYPALSLLGFSSETDIQDLKFVEYFAGNRVHSQSNPAAHCYCGYQFGSFSGQLGDGAAMSLGEVVNPLTNERWELQLKGAGPTPYSRQSDGRKVLRSSIREFLASEAMHSLGSLPASPHRPPHRFQASQPQGLPLLSPPTRLFDEILSTLAPL